MQEALGWADGDTLVTPERLGLVEVTACASATNGASATTRLEALLKDVPRPGGSSDGLMKAGLKVLRNTLTVCSGPSTPSTRWAIDAAKYCVSFSTTPSTEEEMGTISAFMERQSLVRPRAAKCQTREQFLSLLSHMAVHLFFTHVFEKRLNALAMADFLHIRRIQSVGYGGDNPIPFAHVRGFIKDRSIVQSSLLRGQAQDALCHFTALARAEYLLRSLVGGSENGGGACATTSTLVPQIAKVTSTPGFLKLVVCYTEAMGCRSTSSFRFRRRR